LVSGNPVYAGLVKTASLRNSSPMQSKPPTKEQMFTKLSEFYRRIDPEKNEQDIRDLALWASVYGEDALYAKLRKKYGTDPLISSAPRLVLRDEDVKF